MSKSTPVLESTSLASANPTERITILRDRSAMLRQVRHFFQERNVHEVDCPILSRYAAVDAHIDLITAQTQCSDHKCYLHSSPEYGMKRLLAEGIGDIYQLSHVFRDGEVGHKHNPEFTMIEWYRLGISYEAIIDETMDVISLFVGDYPRTTHTYREVLMRYAGFDYTQMTEAHLWHYIQEHQIESYAGIEKEGKDALLNLILGTIVEPHLGQDSLCALIDYPATQAALAKTQQRDEEHVAMRYEIYHRGIELANGYYELTDQPEQRERFIHDNAQRVANGKEALPIDEHFLEALKEGLPECCGVAVGFDRLMMLRHHKNTIDAVIPFSWQRV